METKEAPQEPTKNEGGFQKEQDRTLFDTMVRQAGNDLYEVCPQNVPVTTREPSVNKALEILDQHAKELSEGMVEKSTDVFFFLRSLANYATRRGHKGESDELIFLKRKVRNALLFFLDNARDSLRSLITASFVVDESGRLEDPFSDEHSFIFHFCHLYGKLAFAGSDSTDVKSALSFIHAVSPIEKVIERIRFTRDKDYEITYLYRLALLLGNKKVISDFVNEFLFTEHIPGHNDSGFFGINDLFEGNPPNKSFTNEGMAIVYDMLLKEDAETFMKAEVAKIKKEFTREEIERAQEIFQESPGDRIVRMILENYGLSRDELFKVWKQADFINSVQENFLTIRKLEKIKPGTAQKLWGGPGKIACFERYDIDFLLEQAEPLLEGEPYGIMCSAYEDHNGAFRGRKDLHKKIRDEASALGMKTRLLEYYSERRSLNDLYEKLTGMVPTTEGEPPQLADFIWINQHGESIENKNPPEIYAMSSKWNYVLGVGRNRSSLVLKPGGAVASLMCFGGEKGNVMNFLADQYRVNTTGATKVSYGASGVSFYREGENLFIDVQYNFNEHDPLSAEGKTAIYKQGDMA